MPGASLHRLRLESIQSKLTKPKNPQNTVSLRERDMYRDIGNDEPYFGLEEHTKASKLVQKLNGIRPEPERRSILCRKREQDVWEGRVKEGKGRDVSPLRNNALKLAYMSFKSPRKARN
jgi:hypothetical protein